MGFLLINWLRRRRAAYEDYKLNEIVKAGMKEMGMEDFINNDEWMKDRAKVLARLHYTTDRERGILTALQESAKRAVNDERNAGEMDAFNRGLKEGNKLSTEQQKAIMALSTKLARLANPDHEIINAITSYTAVLNHEMAKGICEAITTTLDNTSREPDYVYDPDDWETTFDWNDKDELVEAIEPAVYEVHRLRTLNQGPDVYLVNVVLTRDEHGDPDETEIRWFEDKEEAEKAALL